MRLSLQDKIALIYTQFGSQRLTADFLGISHQRVGRILKTGSPELGGYTVNSRVLKDPELTQIVDFGLLVHTEIARAQAIADGIPFSAKFPVYSKRLIRSTGELSDRVIVSNTHWLSDNLRNSWIAFSNKTDRYVGISVRSTVNLSVYLDQASKRAEERRKKGGRISKDELRSILLGKMQFELDHTNGVQIKAVYTKKTMMSANFPSSLVIADIEDKLTRKHQPATGDPKTAYADSIVLQLDIRKQTNVYGKDTKRKETRRDKQRVSRNRRK